MQFNVHQWDGKGWNYLATVRAKNETEAVSIIGFRYGIKGRFAAYPHIDSMAQWKSASPFVTVQ